MDRIFVYPGELPRSADFLSLNKNVLYALGQLASAAFGPATAVSGLAIAATGPASLNITIGPGSIYEQETVDATAYGSLGTDSNTVTKQGLLNAPTALTITPPSTSGYSQVFLVEAAYSDVDGGAVVLPYLNSANPDVPFAGPGNSGGSQYTVRAGVCSIALKAGTAAPTGSQVAPTADAGYVPLWLITVANGQTTITSANWALAPGAPFITSAPSMLATIQSDSPNYAVGTGTANAIAASFTPTVAGAIPGAEFRVKILHTNTAAATLDIGYGAQSILTTQGNSVPASFLQAGAIVTFIDTGGSFTAVAGGGCYVGNSNSWLRIAPDGFIEQGGSINDTSDTAGTITFSGTANGMAFPNAILWAAVENCSNNTTDAEATMAAGLFGAGYTTQTQMTWYATVGATPTAPNNFNWRAAGY